MERTVFVLGARDAVLGFALAGVAGLATDDPGVAVQKLEELRRDPRVGMVLITAPLARRLAAAALQEHASLPLVYEIPAPGEQAKRRPLREALRQALGVRV
jgi:vacuolar-type H+-ATPase subunit F/Vma7